MRHTPVMVAVTGGGGIDCNKYPMGCEAHLIENENVYSCSRLLVGDFDL